MKEFEDAVKRVSESLVELVQQVRQTPGNSDYTRIILDTMATLHQQDYPHSDNPFFGHDLEMDPVALAEIIYDLLKTFMNGQIEDSEQQAREDMMTKAIQALEQLPVGEN